MSLAIADLKGKAREDSIQTLLSEIEDSMSERDFQRDFFESLSDQFNRKQYLSDKQVESLQKMYDRVTS